MRGVEILLMEFVIPTVQLLLDDLLILPSELLLLLGQFEPLADLILHRWVIVLPAEVQMALHVVQRCIGVKIRNPRYIFLRCRLVPFLSRNISIYNFIIPPFNMQPPQHHNHYQVLGLARQATKAQVKKAYREMALRYHPDKNEHPEAKVAFNRITSAYQVLADDQKRKMYDDDCTKREKEKQEKDRQEKGNRQAYKPAKMQRTSAYERQFRQEPSAPRHFPKKQKPAQEEQLPRKTQPKKPDSNPQPRSRYKKPHNQAKSSNTTSLFSLLIFILIWYFFPSLSPKRPDFALTANQTYSVRAKTGSLRAPYFLRPDHNNSTNPIHQETVQRLYVRQLEKQCQAALNEKNSFQRMAERSVISSERSTLFELSNRVSTKSCRKIIKLLKRHPELKLTAFANRISLPA